jgi:hemoglobin-like flavoprotein
MTDNQIALVKNSWAQVAKIDQLVVGNIFYSKLFLDTPELRHLFKGGLEEQSKKLLTMLTVVVKGLDKLDALKTAVQQLAIRHTGYGVKNEHYAKVGVALIFTLEQGLGDAFTTATKEAWVTCYTILSGIMMDAGKVETPVA